MALVLGGQVQPAEPVLHQGGPNVVQVDVALLRLHRQGRLDRSGRGIYTLPDAMIKEHHSYAEVAKRVPEAVICLLSALAFHEITTQSPASVWIALRQGARKAALTSPSLRVIRLSGPSLTEGIENHQVEGVTVRVYLAAKTVADCFTFRNKIGLDVAIEALKDSLRQKRPLSTRSTATPKSAG